MRFQRLSTMRRKKCGERLILWSIATGAVDTIQILPGICRYAHMNGNGRAIPCHQAISPKMLKLAAHIEWSAKMCFQNMVKTKA
jgi:hypothetical protein